MATQFTLHADFKNYMVLDETSCSFILLMNEKQIPWVIQVPKFDGIKELTDLPDDVYLQVMNEARQIQRFLQVVYRPDKLNFAALGNMTPQLHLHHMVRFKTDVCWPRPVWGNIQPQLWADQEFSNLHRQVTAQWKAFCAPF